MMCFQFHYLNITSNADLFKSKYFFSLNRMIHPFVFQILRQSKVSDAKNEKKNRTDYEYDRMLSNDVSMVVFGEL